MIRQMLALLILTIPMLAHADSPEKISIQGAQGFQKETCRNAVELSHPLSLSAGENSEQMFGIDSWEGIFDRIFKVKVVSPKGFIDLSALRVPTAQLDAAVLLDRHWRTSLSLPLGGTTAYLSGNYNRKNHLFLSVLPKGWKEPRFFELHRLTKQPSAEVEVGLAKYQISVHVHKLSPMKSDLIFHHAGGTEDYRTILRKVVDAIDEQGDTVQFSDQLYKVYYTSEIVEDAGAGGTRLDPKVKNFIFLLRDGDSLNWFIVYPESLRSDKITVYHMYDDKRIGLQMDGSLLKVYENP